MSLAERLRSGQPSGYTALLIDVQLCFTPHFVVLRTKSDMHDHLATQGVIHRPLQGDMETAYRIVFDEVKHLFAIKIPATQASNGWFTLWVQHDDGHFTID